MTTTAQRVNDEDAFKSGLAAVTRGIRRRNQLPQRIVAQRSGLGKNLISKIENGTANPRLSQLDALGEALGLSGIRELHLQVEEHILRSAAMASQAPSAIEIAVAVGPLAPGGTTLRSLPPWFP